MKRSGGRTCVNRVVPNLATPPRPSWASAGRPAPAPEPPPHPRPWAAPPRNGSPRTGSQARGRPPETPSRDGDGGGAHEGDRAARGDEERADPLRVARAVVLRDHHADRVGNGEEHHESEQHEVVHDGDGHRRADIREVRLGVRRPVSRRGVRVHPASGDRLTGCLRTRPGSHSLNRGSKPLKFRNDPWASDRIRTSGSSVLTPTGVVRSPS